MLRLKSFQILSAGVLVCILGACGKPHEKPTLPGPKPVLADHLILGRELSARDLRALFKILNEKGEFNELAKLLGNLSDSELDRWGKFISTWVYEDALSCKSLIQILKKRTESKGFNLWKKNFDALGKNLPVFFEDEALWDLAPRLVQVLEPAFTRSVLKPLQASYKNGELRSENGVIKKQKLIEELFQLLKKEETRSKLSQLFQFVAEGNWVIPLAEEARELTKQSSEADFGNLAKDLSEKTGSVNQALKLARLLNQPAEKIVTVLQEGLRSNPDIVHAITMKWDPIFIRSLSKIVMQLLLNPEDGRPLERTFWLALPRNGADSEPTQEFHRLYSILYSGLQKISDPRRLEPQADSGSYRLPLQLNALFLTRFLEETIRHSVSQIKDIGPDSFQEDFWKSPLTLKEFRLNLVSDSVKKDLQSLGLLSALSRLENLVKEQDSGKNTYLVSFEEKQTSLAEGLSEALASAHSSRPLADITPFLVTLVQSVSNTKGEGGFSLELFKSSPNILTQVQGFLAQMTPEQWKSIKKTIFEDFKIGQLEIEDRALLVNLFQSDPEVAEWVNEVLMNIQSIYLLDEGTTQHSVFGVYHSFLRHMRSSEISQVSHFLTAISELNLFSENEDGTAVFPGFYSLIKKTDWVAKGLQALGSLSKVQAKMLAEKVVGVFGENLDGEKGSDLFFGYASRLADSTQPEELSGFIERVVGIEWSFSDSEALWLLDFSKRGGFFDLRDLLKDKKVSFSRDKAIRELRSLSEKKIIHEGMRLLTRIQNERMKEIALTLLEMDQSGELISVFDSLRLLFVKGEEK